MYTTSFFWKVDILVQCSHRKAAWQLHGMQIRIRGTQSAFTCSKLTIKTLEQRCEICSNLTIKTPDYRLGNHLRCKVANVWLTVSGRKSLSCYSSMSVKEIPDRKQKKILDKKANMIILLVLIFWFCQFSRGIPFAGTQNTNHNVLKTCIFFAIFSEDNGRSYIIFSHKSYLVITRNIFKRLLWNQSQCLIVSGDSVFPLAHFRLAVNLTYCHYLFTQLVGKVLVLIKNK